MKKMYVGTCGFCGSHVLWDGTPGTFDANANPDAICGCLERRGLIKTMPSSNSKGRDIPTNEQPQNATPLAPFVPSSFWTYNRRVI